MSGPSLRDFPEFVAGDALRLVRTPAPLEQIVLESYTFLPYVRSGIAATVSRPFDWNLSPWRPAVSGVVPVTDDGGVTEPTRPVALTVLGPGDVTAIDARQVIRTYPRPGQHDAEVDDLALIELDRPDFPWMFTPAAPVNGRLVPWVSLVVVDRRFAPVPGRPGSLAVLRDLPRSELPPVDDAWAWAHAQVMGAKSGGGVAPVGDRLAEVNARLNLSRIVCPRRLRPGTAYVACLVPTFKVGVRAGLGQDVRAEDPLGRAWEDGDQQVTLPVYYSWEFATGEDGNFESLARRLRALPAPPGVGRRRMDASRPEFGLAPLDAVEQVVLAPVVSINDPPPGDYPTEAEQQWPPATVDALRDALNAPDAEAHAPGPPADPLVGPPIYAGNHVALQHVDAGAPPWFRDLNLDTRHRVVAGVGTRVVQTEQEALMAEAWNQVAGVEGANRALRLAQFARYVGESLHRRHLARMTPAALVACTERTHSRVLASPGRTVHAELETSALPLSVPTGAFRRFSRPAGPLRRFGVAGVAPRLLVDDDNATRDWVRLYTRPDGIATLSDAAFAVLGDLDRGVLDGLAGPSAAQVMSADRVGQLDVPAGIYARRFSAAVLERILAAIPPEDEIDRDREAAVAAAGAAQLLRTFPGATQEDEWPVDALLAARLGLGDPTSPERLVVVDAGRLTDLAERLLDRARAGGHEIDPDADLGPERMTLSRLREGLGRARELGGDGLRGSLAETSATFVRREGALVDIDRNRVDVASLGLLERLQPAVTVTNRVLGRLGTFPPWLAADWFADRRVEPVMACPHFRYPMVLALHRYDKEWVIPGVGRITQPDLVTMLQTNSVFVEAFLVGLNHEMGRELLWRGYPTDQRGTCFRAFWTTNDELQQEVHAFSPVALGGHLDPRLAGRVVFLVRGELVRRYPGVVAHVAEADHLGAHAIPVFQRDPPAETLFRVPLPPNLLLVGFDITAATAKADPNLWFTLSENPTEPRFGFDESRDVPGPPPSRDDLIWADLGVVPGGFIPTAPRALVAGEPAWGVDAATTAHLLFQLPARAAFPATDMIIGGGG